MINWVH